ncbi:MAG: hypothetical protein CYG60_20205 [Actinobacteria bacterium]|jgi:type IV pilus assembly protein PilO|nr:MAG: hypothetical protein CYG60_20205 [Actinomycetota bacterium]
MDRNDRNILILGILLLLLLAVGYYFLLFSPLRQRYLAAYDERTQREQQRAQLEQSVAELENVRRNAPEIERNILEYSKRLPEQEEIPTLLVQIEQIAEDAGATQLVITPGDPGATAGGATAGGATAPAPADGDFSRIPLTMSFEGTYLEMQDFFFRLKNLSRLVTVNETTWEELQEEGGSTTVAGTEEVLTVEIQAETYVQPASGSTSPAAPAAPGGPTGGTTAAQGTTAAGGT